MKVSVIIPTYNRVEFLMNSVSSVLGQTFKDFELIISDDASTDNTREYVHSLSDPRLKYICNETNLGVAAARNNAVIISKGEYIAFLDDDDQWLSEKLEKQIQTMENSTKKVGCVYTGVITVDLDSNKVTSVSVPKYRGNILNEILPYNFLTTSSILIDKKCIDKVGLFDEEFKGISDFDMWLRIAREYDFDYVKEPLVKRYIHKLRITANYKAVISGLKLIMSKHYELYSNNKRAYSEYKLRLGKYYCHDGNTQEGRKAFAEAIKLYPFVPTNYFCFVLSLFGHRIFKYTSRIRNIVNI